MEEWHTFYDGPWDQTLRWYWSPPNISCFVGIEADNNVSQVEPTQLQEWPNDQGEELIELNLAAQKKEPQSTFINANLSAELKLEFVNLL